MNICVRKGEREGKVLEKIKVDSRKSREVSLVLSDVSDSDTIYRKVLQEYLVVGRIHGDICIESDKSISSPHCEFSFEAGMLYVKDLESTNGTYLDGREITQKSVVLNGSVVRLGETELRVEVV